MLPWKLNLIITTTGWRAISTAWPAALPWPIPGPIADKPIDKPAAITEEAEAIE
jgi:hypothetical protein